MAITVEELEIRIQVQQQKALADLEVMRKKIEETFAQAMPGMKKAMEQVQQTIAAATPAIQAAAEKVQQSVAAVTPTVQSTAKQVGAATEQMAAHYNILLRQMDLQKEKLDRLKASIEAGVGGEAFLSKTYTQLQQAQIQLDKMGLSAEKLKEKMEKPVQEVKKLDKEMQATAQRGKTVFEQLGATIARALKFAVIYKGLRAMFDFIKEGLQNAINAPEIENMFRVAFGVGADEAAKFAEAMKTAYGIDPYVSKQMLGTFQNMSTAMGVGMQNASEMSKGLTLLANDISSLYNVDPQQAAENLQSALSGQGRAVRKYGYIILDSTIKETAYRLGIAETGAELTEQQKVLARYMALQEQSKNAQGDLARTIGNVANQLRILKQNIVAAGRSISTALIPFIQAVIPTLNAFFIVLQRAGNALASFTFGLFGIDFSEWKKQQEAIIGGTGDMSQADDEYADSAEKAAKAQRGLLSGFDKLNISKRKEGAGAGATGEGGFTIPEVETPTGKSPFEKMADQIYKHLEPAVKKMIDLFKKIKDNPVIKAAVKFLSATVKTIIKVIGNLVSFLADNFDTVVVIVSGVIASIVAVKLVTTIQKIAKAITGAGGLMAALKGLIPLLSNPVALAVAAVAGAIAAVAAGIYTLWENTKKADLAKRFGKITLSMEEMQSIAQRMINSKTLETLSKSFEELKKLEGIAESIQSAVNTLDKLNWKIGVGIELTGTEQEDYKAAIDSFVQNSLDYVQQRQYALSLNVEALLEVSDPNYEAVTKSINEISTSITGKLTALGTQLRDATNAGFSDGLLTIDETKKVSELQNQITSIMNVLSQSKFDAKIDFLNLKYGGKNLTPEAYQQLQAELGKAISERTLEVEEGVELQLSGIKANLMYAEMQFEEAPTAENQRLLQEAQGAYSKVLSAESEKYPLKIAELNLVATSFNLNTVKGAYQSELDKLIPDLSRYTVLAVNDAFDYASAGGEFNLSKFVFGIEKDLKDNFNNTLTPAMKSNIKDLLKASEPQEAELKAARDKAIQAGIAVPESISKGITDIAMLKTLVGDTAGVLELIGNTVSNSPEQMALIKQLQGLGYAVPEEIINAMSSKNTNIVRAGNEISSGIFTGAKEQLEKDKDAWMEWAWLPWNWFREKNEIHSPSKLFEGGGQSIVQGLINGVIGKMPAFTLQWSTAMADWWNNNVTVWFTVDKWKGLFDSISTAFGSVMESIKNIAAEVWGNVTSLFSGEINISTDSASKSRESLRSVPHLARGGVLTAPRLVMAGEYPGASTDPEIVSPQSLMYETSFKAQQAANQPLLARMDKLIGLAGRDMVSVWDGREVARMVREENNRYNLATGMG